MDKCLTSSSVWMPASLAMEWLYEAELNLMAEAAMASLTVQAGLYSLWGSGAGGGRREDERREPGDMKNGGGSRARWWEEKGEASI